MDITTIRAWVLSPRVVAHTVYGFLGTGWQSSEQWGRKRSLGSHSPSLALLPEHLPAHSFCGSKIVFQEIGPCCQKGWRSLLVGKREWKKPSKSRIKEIRAIFGHLRLKSSPGKLFTLCSVLCYVASVRTGSVTPWAIACQAPLFMGVSRQEYWSGLPCHLPGDLLNPGIEPKSLATSALAGRFFTTSTSC